MLLRCDVAPPTFRRQFGTGLTSQSSSLDHETDMSDLYDSSKRVSGVEKTFVLQRLIFGEATSKFRDLRRQEIRRTLKRVVDLDAG